MEDKIYNTIKFYLGLLIMGVFTYEFMKLTTLTIGICLLVIFFGYALMNEADNKRCYVSKKKKEKK